MAKTNITQPKLEVLQNQELILISKISSLTTDIEQWQVAINALESDVKLPIASGISSVFDALKTQLDNAENEQERQTKLIQYKDAIATSKASLELLRKELISIQKEIQIETGNEYFEINIKPHYPKYEAAFTKFDDQRQAKINSIQKDLSSYRSDYDLIRRFMAGDRTARLDRLNSGSHDYKKHFQRLENEFIPGCEKQLDDLNNQPLPDKLSSPEFRAWLTSRVLLDESIAWLIKANKEALEAQREFRELAVKYPQCLEFKLYELPESIKVLEIDSKGKIVLSNKEI
ncbi:hypothetical protein NIES25_70250 (plasmid) [Nostoc linckia NIES-25]|nr:hypothetical protein NIES25_70250 [Nostoc linckia NIES-25]